MFKPKEEIDNVNLDKEAFAKVLEYVSKLSTLILNDVTTPYINKNGQ